jgi:hypothetical protein
LQDSVAQRVLPWPTELAYRSIYPISGKAGVSKTARFNSHCEDEFPQPFCGMMDDMDTKKPAPQSKFAEVTKRAQEERAKKPKQKRDDPNQGIPKNLRPRDANEL